MTPQSDAKTSLPFFSYPLTLESRWVIPQGNGFFLSNHTNYLSQLEGITF